MSPGKQEQKTPTEDELSEFERRKNTPPAAPTSFAPRAPSSSRSRATWTALSGVVIACFLAVGGFMGLMMTTGDRYSSASAPAAGEGNVPRPTVEDESEEYSKVFPGEGSGEIAATPMPSATRYTSATPATSMRAASIRDILTRPDQYMQTEIHVTATFRRKVSARSFIAGDGDLELLVLTFDHDTLSLDRLLGREVRVDGSVRSARGMPFGLKGDYKGEVYLDAVWIAEN